MSRESLLPYNVRMLTTSPELWYERWSRADHHDSWLVICGNQMSANFGKIIKQLREERFLRPSEIERISRAIASDSGNSRFYISHGSLDNIESSENVPGIFKIFSLAVCFRLSY